MNLDDHVHHVRDQLTAAAALGDERTQQIAETLGTSLDSAVRLAILNALSDAVGEVNAALFEASGGQGAAAITVHLDGSIVRVAVSHAPVEAEEPRTDDGEATARITLRLSEALKADIEDAASRADVSVNTWLVRAAANAAGGGGRFGGPGWPFGGGMPGAPGGWNPGPNWSGGHGGRGSNRITGWVSG